MTKLFFPAVTGDLLRKVKNQKNKENRKLVSFSDDAQNHRVSQEVLLPFGIDVQNRGRIEFLMAEIESLKHVATYVNSLIKAKHC